MSRPRPSLPLLLGDAVALTLFVFLGQIDHDLLALPRLALQSAFLVIPWLLVALALRAAAPAPGDTWRTFLGRSLLAWLVAAPLALLLRALVQGQATIIVAFMLVTLSLGGLFLLTWRTFYLTIHRRPKGT